MYKVTFIFHIGYPKSGSTTLQRCLWAKHSEVINLGINPKNNIGRDLTNYNNDQIIDKDERIIDFYNYLCKTDATNYPYKKVKKLFNSIYDTYKEPNKKIIFSNESILSTRFSYPVISEKIRRIKFLDQDFKIIVIIRSQDSILKSLYRDHPFDPIQLESKKKPVNLDSFLKIDRCKKYFSHCSSLNYLIIYQYISNLFGKKNVLFLPLEMLSINSEEFCNKLSNFCGLDNYETFKLLNDKMENIGPTILQNKFRKLFTLYSPIVSRLPYRIRKLNNKLESYVESYFKTFGSKEKIFFSEKSTKFLLESFKEANLKLSSDHNLDLKKYGYFLK